MLTFYQFEVAGMCNHTKKVIWIVRKDCINHITYVAAATNRYISIKVNIDTWNVQVIVQSVLPYCAQKGKNEYNFFICLSAIRLRKGLLFPRFRIGNFLTKRHIIISTTQFPTIFSRQNNICSYLFAFLGQVAKN